MKKVVIIVSSVLLITACNKVKDENLVNNTETLSTQNQSVERIVSLNGTLTEIVSALGHQNEIVGVDITSTYPTEIANTTENLDHVFKLSVEKLINLKPTKVVALENELKPEIVTQLTQAGINVITFKQTYTPEGTKQLIADVAQKLENNNIEAIQSKIDNEIATISPLHTAPKVLFIYARANQMMVGGTGTPIEAMIKLAGGVNAVTEFSEYKPLTPEALIKANPDYILLFDKGLQSIGGVDGLLKVDGISKTNAGKNKKIISMDGLLLSGFGPRLGEAVKILNSELQK